MKLLSICIPTFNRANYLKNTLYSIVSQEKYCEECEIIISDNNSTDNTREVGEYFSEKHENIRYYCNETNIGAERNFLKLLDYGQGKYLKLHNDKACFYKDKLNNLLEYLLNIDHSVVFILNECDDRQKKGIIECEGIDDFVQIVSYRSTWMCGIIFKNTEYQNLPNKDRAIGSFLNQTDIMFRLLKDSDKSMIINEKLQYEQEVEYKGGYNLFEVFISNYLGFYQDYLRNGILSQKTYRAEKINLLKEFVFPWYTRMLLLKDKRYQFNISKAHRTILEHYWNEPRLLLYPLYVLNKGVMKICN